MAALSRADVEHVAHLARLGLTEEELARLEGQLNHILDQYTILTTLDTEHIPPTAQTIELANILRDDAVDALADRRTKPCPTPRSGAATTSSCRRSSAAARGARSPWPT